ncbi:MAG: hypothetical protein JJV97_03790 [SAR324 cluster bacterium]|nr:hypothetical protein [SAR324 cluster bacterium]
MLDEVAKINANANTKTNTKLGIDFLYNLGAFNIKLGLSTIKRLLAKLDNPHQGTLIIHFAGTNGKGSSIITLESLLIAAGYRVASTVSPHLIEFNERFRYQGKSINNQELSFVLGRVWQACSINDDNCHLPKRWQIRPTFFEAQIAMFFVWAKLKKVDYMLVETGLGGRLDATNVVVPHLVAITSISYDHQKYLGNSLALITKEKLGIVKTGAPCFIAKQSPEVLKAIREHSVRKDFYYYGKDFGYKYIHDGDHNKKIFYTNFKKSIDNNQQISQQCELKSLKLVGAYQWQNTATALAIYYYLVGAKGYLGASQIRKTLKKIDWPGRLEYISQKPAILIDAAHNDSGIESLFQYLKDKHSSQKILLATCWMEDKSLSLSYNKYNFHKITYQPLKLANQRAKPADIIKKELEAHKLTTNKPLELAEFVKSIKKDKYKEFALLVITGSLYLLGDFLKIWQSRNI